jgi:hypothetical protein
MCLHQTQILSKYGRPVLAGYDFIQERPRLAKSVLIAEKRPGDRIILEHFDNRCASWQLILEDKNVTLGRDVPNGITEIGRPIQVDSPTSCGFPCLRKSGCEPLGFVRNSCHLDRDAAALKDSHDRVSDRASGHGNEQQSGQRFEECEAALPTFPSL